MEEQAVPASGPDGPFQAWVGEVLAGRVALSED